MEQALDEDFGVEGTPSSTSSIGPTFGEQIARTACSRHRRRCSLISLYIGLRFELKFAVPSSSRSPTTS